MCFNEVLYQLEEFPHLFIGGGHKGYFIVYNYLSEELVESANVDCISAVVTMIKKLNNNSDVTNWDSLVNSCKKIWDNSSYSFSKCFNCKSNNPKHCGGIYMTGDELELSINPSFYTNKDFERYGTYLEFIQWENNKQYTIGSFVYELKGNRFFIYGIDEYALHYDLPTNPQNSDVLDALKDFSRNHYFDELDLSHPLNHNYEPTLKNFKDMSYPTEYLSISELELICRGILGYSYPINFINWRKECENYQNSYESLETATFSEPIIKPSLKQHEIISKDNNSMNRNQKTEGYNDWKNKVTKRDNHTCVVCGYTGKHLERHHMFGYAEHPELATNVDNGVTLCKWCHQKYHSIYGKKNINPIDFVNFVKKFGVTV